MANNRIMMKCLVCGETYPIAKTFGSGYALSNVFSEENLQKFLDDHTFCEKGEAPGGEGEFGLEYELAMHPFEEHDVYKCAGCGTGIVGWYDPIDGVTKNNYCHKCGMKQDWTGVLL